MKYEAVIENITQSFTSGKYVEEVVQAKVAFHKAAGAFDEESPDFEMKMSQFSDWYVFTRFLKEEGVPPVALCESDTSNEELVENLRKNIHSLFEFIKIKKNDVYVKDLITKKKYIIKDCHQQYGFNRDEFFEARLIPLGETYVFSGAFCFHPPQVSKYVTKEAKLVNKFQASKMATEAEKRQCIEDLILKLFKMRYKFEQYQHVDVMDIYSNEAKLKV